MGVRATGFLVSGAMGVRPRDFVLWDAMGLVITTPVMMLLGYALGREVQLSDEPLLSELQKKLATEGYRFGVAVEAIVRSPQFREIRGATASEE